MRGEGGAVLFVFAFFLGGRRTAFASGTGVRKEFPNVWGRRAVHGPLTVCATSRQADPVGGPYAAVRWGKPRSESICEG